MPEIIAGRGLKLTKSGNNLTVDTPLNAVADYVSHAAAVAAAAAAGFALFVGTAAASTLTNGAAITAPHASLGAQITTADGNKRGKWFANVTAAPASTGNPASIDTAFNGDWSKVIFAIEHRISGTATLAQPTSGYVYTNEAYPIFLMLDNQSGWNNGTADNTGRTAAAAIRVMVKQRGQGDAPAFNASVFVNATRASSTHYLANPAGSIINGDISAGQAGVYLNACEFDLNDSGFDVAGGAITLNLTRSVATGAKSAWWWAFRVQSNGSQSVNNILSATGKFNGGIDLCMTTLDFGANKGAICIKADDRIYLNNSSSNGYYSTSFNGWYFTYSSSASAIVVVANGGSVLQVAAGQITMLKPPVLPIVTAAGLPGASTSNKGMEYYLSDLNSTTRGAPAAGGGANFGKVYSNGTNWIIA